MLKDEAGRGPQFWCYTEVAFDARHLIWRSNLVKAILLTKREFRDGCDYTNADASSDPHHRRG